MKSAVVELILLKLFLLNLIGSVDAQPDTYTYQLIEEMPTGTFVADVKRDAGVTSPNITFVILSSGFERNLFTLNARSGVIRTANVLDREVLCPKQPTCTITVDIALQPQKYFKNIKLRIDIIDINDNAPKFSTSRLTESLSEDTAPGFFFPIQAADDRDSPTNGVVSYRHMISGGSKAFELKVRRNSDGSSEPQLELVEALDRELIAFYTVKIIAIDGGNPPRSGSVVMDITIDDVNDNAPKFTSQVYEVELEENASPTKSLLTVSAVDQDDGLNGKVVYEFSAKTNHNYLTRFSISPDTGVISTLQQLDYEEQSLVVLEVIARDQGDSPIPSTAHVTVIVRDLNDNAPQIAVSGEKLISITENSAASRFVAHISVTDLDSKENGLVHCSINSPQFWLVDVMKNEYKLVTSDKPLDHESVQSHTLVFTCSDEGSPSLTTSATLDITVEDMNDNEPRFLQSVYNFTALEGVSPPAWIGRVTAEDLDAVHNAVVQYRLDADSADYVHIDSRTGVITAAVEFHRDTLRTFQFHVLAVDRGDPAQTSKVLVNVEIVDVNDDRASGPTANVFRILENLPPSTVVGQISLPHSDVIGRHVYLLEGDNNADFQLTNETIFTKRPLDREQVHVYHLSVASHHERIPPLRRHVTDVIICVMDVNDNAPVVQFPASGYDTAHVMSDASVGHLVTRILATDSDAGLNGSLTYEIGGTTSYHKEFAVDAATGNVYVNSSISAMPGMTFRFLVFVKDMGTPARNTTAALKIVVDSTTAARSLLGPPRASSQSHWFLIIAVTGVTLFIVIVLLVLIVICKRRRRANASEASSVTSKTTKADVTLMETSANQQLNQVLSDFQIEMCDCDSVIGEHAYIDADGMFVINRQVKLIL